jgi:hypothetical protein
VPRRAPQSIIQHGSDSANQPKDQHDQKDQPEPTAGVIAPAGAIRPAWQGADQQKDQNNYQNCAHEPSVFSLCAKRQSFSVALALLDVAPAESIVPRL